MSRRQRPRWVVDTNVLVSAFLWKGKPGRVLELAAEGEIHLITSRPLLDELRETLSKPRLARYVSATGLLPVEMLQHYRRLATLVHARALAQRVSRDVDDDTVLACALAGRAGLIVSGDDDLLSLRSFSGIPIVAVAQAVAGFNAAP